jgi:hypothetical protein
VTGTASADQRGLVGQGAAASETTGAPEAAMHLPFVVEQPPAQQSDD